MTHASSNQKGFAAVEAVLLIIILALVGGTGYFVYHSNKSTSTVLTNASQDASSSPSKVTKKAATVTSTSSVNSTQAYLSIKELGIKLPLTSDTTDLGYTWEASGGYNGYPVAMLGSKTLANEFEQADPTDCPASTFASVNGLYPISDIYSTHWSGGGSGGSKEVKSIIAGGKNYYWYTLGAGGCDVSPSTTLQNEVTDYYNAALSDFSAGVAN